MMDNNDNDYGQGYVITACDSPDGAFIQDALHVEPDTRNWIYDDDESAARAAQRDGVKLVYGIPYVADGVYLDTPENRDILEMYSDRIARAVQRRKEKNARRKP